jgi:hypothetical protein
VSWEPCIQAGSRANAANFVVFTTFATFCQRINLAFMDFDLRELSVSVLSWL